MKLRKLHIEDYKMFKDFDISFVDEHDETLPIIVLAGVNGSGKTTILKSIFDSNDLISSSTRRYTIPTSKINVEERKDINIQLIIEKNKSNIVQFNKPIDIEINNRSISEEEKEFYLDHIFSIYLEDGCKNYNNRGDNFFGKLATLENMIGDFIDDLIYEKDIVASMVYDQVRVFIANVLDDLEMDITFNSLNKTRQVIMSNSQGKKFLLKDLSSGEKILFSQILFLYFSTVKDSIVLIDEPELSLHPSWQNKVLKIYENYAFKNNCQIIIATHSPHIIGSAKPEYIRVLKKVDEKIEVEQYNQSYGLEFSQILTNIMGLEYLRTPDVAKRMDRVKALIIQNEYDSKEFKDEWQWLEENLGKNYLDLKLLKLEIASRRKNASNS